MGHLMDKRPEAALAPRAAIPPPPQSRTASKALQKPLSGYERAKLEELWGTVERWVHENDVSCPEVISQSDSVNLSLADLVASLVEIVGFEEDRGDL